MNRVQKLGIYAWLAAVLAALAAGLPSVAHAQSTARASQLIGNQVSAKSGAQLAWLNDLVLDLQENRVAYAVLSLDGERLIPCRLAECGATVQESSIQFGLTPKSLREMPGFSRNEWQQFTDGLNGSNGTSAGSTTDAGNGTNGSNPASGSTPVNGSNATSDASGANPASAAPAPAAPRFVRASDALKANIKDRTGKRIGSVKDVLISTKDATVAGVVVDFDPAWNNIGTLVALPLSSMAASGPDFLAKFESRDIRPASAQSASTTASATPAAAPPPPPRPETERRLSQLIGNDVVDTGGRRLGKLTDVLLDAQAGKMTHALVAVEGNAAPVACPLEGRELKLSDKGLALVAGDLASCAAQVQQPGLQRGTRLLEAAVSDPSGADVGRVRDIVVNVETKTAHFAVAKLGPNLVQPGFLVAVPLRVHAPKGDAVVMSFDPVELNRTYFFAENQWPDLNDPAFRAQIEPYVRRR